MKLELSDWKRLVGLSLLALIFFTIVGCGDVVKIIVVPASMGGAGFLLFLLFSTVAVVSHKPVTPEQEQRQQMVIQQREVEQRRREEMDLPAGLTPSSNNFVRTNENIALSTIVVTSRTLSPYHNFQIYYKGSSVDSSWQRAKITNITVQNPNNLENAGLVARRLLFNVKDTVWTNNKVVVMWND